MNSIIVYMNAYMYFYYIWIVAFGILLIMLSVEIVNMACEYSVSICKNTKGNVKGARLEFVIHIANKLLVMIVVIVLLGYMLQRLGVDMVHFFTALGIGGLAFALAGKDTVENLFGSIMLALERPFKIGDWVVIDGAEGTVEKIGLRSTTIRTFANSELIIPNYTFIASKLDNMGARVYRRYKTKLDIEDSTSPELLQAYVDGLDEIVQNTPCMRKKDYHIRVNDIGESSIHILIYVFFVSIDWAEELRQREKFIIDMITLAEEMGVNFAFPSQTVFLDRIKKHNIDDFDISRENDKSSYARQIGHKITKKYVTGKK